ncbi:MAG TPA: hypothetical protein VJQ51_02175 [Burkholderiales bacterium]|nr:hypothetical protein [Burkholderiales bacterium]
MAAAVVLLGLPIAQDASAQKIVCWKDKAGKTVGCGDKVPPEYQDNASQEIDKRGVVRKTNESADEKAKRLVKEKEDEKTKAERDKKAAEQRRLDSALVNTYTNEKEIDLRRDRDLATIDGQITQMKVMQKNAQDRQKEVKTRIGAKPATEVQKEELARADATVTKADQAIVDKEKEKEDIRARYAAMRARFTELKGGSSAPAPAPAPASTAKK